MTLTPTICARRSGDARGAREVLLHLEAVALVLVTVLLAGPVSVYLARATWTARAPRPALLLWQAVGLGGGLGVLTAGLTLAAADLDRRWLPGVVAIPTRWHELGGWGWLGIGLTVCVGIYLLAAAVTSSLRVHRARREHRQRLAMISRALPSPGETSWRDAPVRLLDHPHAVAYGLPGFRPQVVLTRGALDALSPAELDAVLAHEQAHARGRHDLVVQPFVAWARTFPFLRPARKAVVAVGLLVETLADDAALARCSRKDLRSAVGKLASHHLDVAESGSLSLRAQLEMRMTRLGEQAAGPLPWPIRTFIYTAAVVIVVAPPLVLVLS